MKKISYKTKLIAKNILANNGKKDTVESALAKLDSILALEKSEKKEKKS
jgi:hypothetical protein